MSIPNQVCVSISLNQRTKLNNTANLIHRKITTHTLVQKGIMMCEIGGTVMHVYTHRKTIGVLRTVPSAKRVHFGFFQFLAHISIIQYAMDKSNI